MAAQSDIPEVAEVDLLYRAYLSMRQAEINGDTRSAAELKSYICAELAKWPPPTAAEVELFGIWMRGIADQMKRASLSPPPEC